MKIARLTNRYELHFDPTDRSPIIRERGVYPGRRPKDLKHSLERRELQVAVRKLFERQELERQERGAPLMALPAHIATLNAAIELNDDIPNYTRRYMEEVA